MRKKETALKELGNKFKGIKTLYNIRCINWKGKTSDEPKEYFTEVFSSKISKTYWEKLKLVSEIPRIGGYIVESHYKPGALEINSNSNRHEEILAKKLVRKYRKEKFLGLGKIVDYQIPLKSPRLKNPDSNNGLGKIDLVSLDDEYLNIIELKKHGSTETLLRAVLEVYTYFKIVDHKSLLDNMNGKHDEETKKVRPCVLVPKDSLAAQEYYDLGNREKLRDFIKEVEKDCGLKIIVF